ncbi:MAG: energy-coupling factor transporter ATPase [Lachnospiraceae bacterium]|nr:energy-coupling factor transporter ATPase [Lachnospiraceae bacterium]MBR4574216.1 energy-coupling factor transporter ATPase [Lachnospiraceae bacterium]
MPIIVNHMDHIYNPGTVFEKKAIDDVSFTIEDGEYVGLAGRTGSGKSTLALHLNGLMKPTAGGIYFDGVDISSDGYDLKKLRSQVGLVFQYPEHQLFEEDVFTDVCFGPKNLGLPRQEVELRAYEALKAVGIPDDRFYVSPFDISGGEKRRAAIAGVLAMKPKVLVLDEPCAGLDPGGREEILSLCDSLHAGMGITIILISHSMDDLAEHVERMLVMNDGKLAMDDSSREVFKRREELESMGLTVPQVSAILSDLARMGLDVDTGLITVEEAKQEILRALSR